MGVRRLGRAIGLCIGVYLATLTVVVVVAWGWPVATLPERADAIVCLGGGSADGVLTRGSFERAVSCADLYADGAAPQIVMTGSMAGPLMAQVALDRGVPLDAIVVEPDSRSTLQNALFTAEIVPTDARIIVVTDAFHLPRSWVAYRVMGYDDIALSASSMARLQPRPLIREALAIWFNAGRIVIWWATPWLPAEDRAALLT